ncbi:MAG: hypothetical protein OXI01_17230 [Albidovulum sp.]|nr:hypothetical protein [Albidovulum sp.]
MAITRFRLVLALTSALGLSAQTATSEELTVATFVPSPAPQQHDYVQVVRRGA